MRYHKKQYRKRQYIARDRMGYLFELARREGAKHNMCYANRYVEIARKLGMRHRISVTREQKHLFCRKCGACLQPGFNAKVRVQSGKVVRHCLDCGAIRRVPLNSGQK